MSITRLFQTAAFESDLTHAMGKAFEHACSSLRHGEHSDLIREIIAKQIVAAAGRGVADPAKLSEEALASLGLPTD